MEAVALTVALAVVAAGFKVAESLAAEFALAVEAVS